MSYFIKHFCGKLVDASFLLLFMFDYFTKDVLFFFLWKISDTVCWNFICLILNPDRSFTGIYSADLSTCISILEQNYKN